MPNVSVRRATVADSVPLSQSLARAFYTDPVFAHFLPDETTRLKKLEKVMGILFKLGEPHGACYTTDNYESVTLWRPPSEWDVPFMAYITNGPALLSAFGMGIGRVLSTMDMMEKIHPHTPHWYLQTIGTDPQFQGKGYGGVIMRDRLSVVDAVHMPCYLESSKDTNIPIYQSFGFKVTGEIQVPNGPKIWPMWERSPLMMRAFSVIICACAFTIAALAQGEKPRADAGAAPPIAITGVKDVSEIWIANLRTYPAMLVPVTQQTGKGPMSATFKGALLWQVIDRAGWINGKEKNGAIRHTILITGKDGYAAALSEGEIDPKLENKQVILAYEEDGKPLDAPRLVVPGDLHAARSVQDVVRIDVR